MRQNMHLGTRPKNASYFNRENKEQTLKKCRVLLNQIRRICGPETAGARLSIKPTDTSYQVVCYYDDTEPQATLYAIQCEEMLPSNWDDEALKELL